MLHRRKIELADELLIIAPGGYVGESTAQEIAYGESLEKPIRFWGHRQVAQSVDPVEALVSADWLSRSVLSELRVGSSGLTRLV